VARARLAPGRCRYLRHLRLRPDDLLTVTAADVRTRKTGTANPANFVELDRTARPRRANILDE
jgi:hypothetical protein